MGVTDARTASDIEGGNAVNSPDSTSLAPFLSEDQP